MLSTGFVLERGLILQLVINRQPLRTPAYHLSRMLSTGLALEEGLISKSVVSRWCLFSFCMVFWNAIEDIIIYRKFQIMNRIF